MKKILGLTALTALLVCCDFGPRQSLASSVFIDKPSGSSIYVTSQTVNGMEYKIFSMYNGGMSAVNVTKDKLEVELLQKQINEIDKRNKE